MSASRLAEMFADARSQGRAVFMPFMTAGLPDLETAPDLFAQLATDGADAFEVGIPYSDPLMDGPVIQSASQLALAVGHVFDRTGAGGVGG